MHYSEVEDMKKLLERHETYVLAIIILLSILITSINPNFLTLENAFDLLKSNAFTGILAIGVLFVLISGGIDIVLRCNSYHCRVPYRDRLPSDRRFPCCSPFSWQCS